MILAKKVRLYPSEIQEQKLWQSVGTARFIDIYRFLATVLLLLLLIGFVTFKSCTYFAKRDCENSGGTYINNKCIYEPKPVVG